MIELNSVLITIFKASPVYFLYQLLTPISEILFLFSRKLYIEEEKTRITQLQDLGKVKKFFTRPDKESICCRHLP